MRHFLRDDDLKSEDRAAVLDLAGAMKLGAAHPRPLNGRSVALLFDKPSTRTRVTFSVAINELGGVPITLDSMTTHIGRGEPVQDTARVLERQVAAIVWRTFEQHDLQTMAAFSHVPVINALSDRFHPCQGLADMLTIRERFGSLDGLTLTYLGDITNNMANTYLLSAAAAGMHIRLAGPSGLEVDETVVRSALCLADATGGSVGLFHDAYDAAKNADVLATDTWASMGAASFPEEVEADFPNFAITPGLLEVASTEAIVLHCLPAYRGKEIDADVLEGPRSVVWDQAENRKHVQKALLVELLASVEPAEPSLIELVGELG